MLMLPRQFRQAEIEHLGASAGGKKNIRRFDVAMNNSLAMGGVERVCNLNRDVEKLVVRKRPRYQALGQRFAFEHFHSYERLAIMLADLVNGADIFVIDGRSRAGLVAKALQGCSIRSQIARKKLQRNPPPQRKVLGLVNHAHAATADLPNNFVVRDS